MDWRPEHQTWNHKTPRTHQESTPRRQSGWWGFDFLDMMPRTKATKAKMNKYDFIKLKSFCTKRPWTKWKEASTQNIKKKQTPTTQRQKTNLIKKWAEDLNTHLSKDIQVPTVAWKMFHITGHQRNPNQNHNKIPSNIQTNSAGEDVEKRQVLGTTGGNVNWHSKVYIIVW